MNIILIAPPAAGKGTQSELICKRYQMNHISTGDLLREVANKDDEKSLEIKEMMNNGLLISDEIILDLIEGKIKEDDSFIFDGFPRTLNQAVKFDELLNKLNKKIDYVIYLKVNKDIAVNRIDKRYVCPKCNNVYTIDNEPKICKNCGSELSKRKDDNVETFEERYNVYMNETFPIIDYYRNQGLVHEVDSSKTPNEVFDEIESIIG